ncbi:MAG: cache domain-containing protein [Bryobacteraceae bacterium]
MIQIGALARMPAVLDAVGASNREQAGLSDTAFQEKVTRLEKIWNTPAADSTVRDLLGSPAARMLRAQLAADPRLLRITLTDARGAAIAATHKTLDYYQADEEFWQAISAQGRGAVNLTDILYDEVTHSNYIGIGVPVMEPDTNRFIGALDVLMDLSTIFPEAATRRPGSSMQMMLVKKDGTVITGPGTTLSMKVKAPEWAALVDAQLAGGASGSMLASLTQGEEVVAFADTGLGSDYRNLSWAVLVSQNAREALAPLAGIVRLFFLFIFAGLVALVALGVYFALHRTVHYEDIEDAMQEESKRRAVGAAS